MGWVSQKGFRELRGTAALYGRTVQESYTFEDRLRLSLYEEMS